MPSIPKISIARYENFEELRRAVENTINSLIDRINNTKSSVDAGGDRVTNVGKPASRTDAVNLQYLDEVLKNFTGGNNRRTDVTTTFEEITSVISDEIIITKS